MQKNNSLNSIFKVIFFLLILFSTSRVFAVEKIDNTYFRNQKILSETPYIYHDFIEFTVFDMSDLKLIYTKGSEKKSVPMTVVTEKVKKQLADKKVKEKLISDLSKIGKNYLYKPEDLQVQFKNAPKYFYKSLKQKIFDNKVPVTLVPKTSPSYANPIELYIKIKKVEIMPVVMSKNGNKEQTLKLSISGKLTEKVSFKSLTEFQDELLFTVKESKNNKEEFFPIVADHFMNRLTKFLRTKY